MYLNQISKYWDSRAEGYSRTIHEQFAAGQDKFFRDKLRRGEPQGECLDCLDIGCGPGFFSILLAQDGHNVTAVDYSEGMLEQARANFKEAGVEVQTAQGDAQNLPFADGSFDYIVSRNLVWNLEQPEQAYREWMRILKPGGHLFVADANHYLYYFDNDYIHLKTIRDNYDPKHTHGVDPTPINDIARDLPMSKVLRPKWDMETLLALGMVQLNVDVKHAHVVAPDTGEEKAIITDFYLSAEKPAETARLTEEELQERIDAEWSAASDNYSKIVHDELESFRADAWKKLILENAPKKQQLDILDAGCGPAFFSILLSQEGHRVVGLDGAEGMLRHASENAAEYGVSPLFLKGDCHALPFADNSFDLVVSRNVTHALRDHRKAYAEWRRVLRPGGVLLIFDANWHLMQTDPQIRREFTERNRQCIEKYGSNFNGDGGSDVKDSEKLGHHRLGTVKRPVWDEMLLRQAGFENVLSLENIIDGIWDNKEKLLYGLTPMFMIKAE